MKRCDFCQGEFEEYELTQVAEYLFCADCACDSEVQELQEQQRQQSEDIAETYGYVSDWLNANK